MRGTAVRSGSLSHADREGISIGYIGAAHMENAAVPNLDSDGLFQREDDE